jgi:hypothetical protein
MPTHAISGSERWAGMITVATLDGGRARRQAACALAESARRARVRRRNWWPQSMGICRCFPGLDRRQTAQRPGNKPASMPFSVRLGPCAWRKDGPADIAPVNLASTARHESPRSSPRWAFRLRAITQIGKIGSAGKVRSSNSTALVPMPFVPGAFGISRRNRAICRSARKALDMSALRDIPKAYIARKSCLLAATRQTRNAQAVHSQPSARELSLLMIM